VVVLHRLKHGKEGDNLPGDIRSTCGSEHPSEDDGEEEEEEGSGSEGSDDDENKEEGSGSEKGDDDEEEDDKPPVKSQPKKDNKGTTPLTRRPTGFPPQQGGGKGLASRGGKVVPVGDAMEVDQAEKAVGPSKSAAPVSTRPPAPPGKPVAAAAAAKPVASTKPVAAAAAAKPVASTKPVAAIPLPLIPRLVTAAPVSLLGGVQPIPVETTAVVPTLSVAPPPPAPVIDADAMEVGGGWASMSWPEPTTSNLSLLAGAAGGSYCPTSPNSWHESQQAQRFNFGPWAGEEDQGGDSLFPGLRQALNEVAAGPAAPPPPADRD